MECGRRCRVIWFAVAPAGEVELLEQIASALESIADVVARGAVGSPKSRRVEDGLGLSTQARAMVWCLLTSTTENRAIADEFGVHIRTVQRWNALQEVLDSLRLVGNRKSGVRSAAGAAAASMLGIGK